MAMPVIGGTDCSTKGQVATNFMADARGVGGRSHVDLEANSGETEVAHLIEPHHIGHEWQAHPQRCSELLTIDGDVLDEVIAIEAIPVCLRGVAFVFRRHARLDVPLAVAADGEGMPRGRLSRWWY